MWSSIALGLLVGFLSVAVAMVSFCCKHNRKFIFAVVSLVASPFWFWLLTSDNVFRASEEFDCYGQLVTVQWPSFSELEKSWFTIIITFIVYTLNVLYYGVSE